MLYLKTIYNITENSSIISCIKNIGYDFQTPIYFKIFIDFKYYDIIKIDTVIVKRYEKINDCFEYIDLSVSVKLDKNITRMGSCIVLIPS